MIPVDQSSCTPVFSVNKTDHQDITEILLKVAINMDNPMGRQDLVFYFGEIPDLVESL